MFKKTIKKAIATLEANDPNQASIIVREHVQILDEIERELPKLIEAAKEYAAEVRYADKYLNSQEGDLYGGSNYQGAVTLAQQSLNKALLALFKALKALARLRKISIKITEEAE